MFNAFTPTVAYSDTEGMFLVVYQANVRGFAPLKYELFGQYVDTSGRLVGNRGFQISSSGLPSDSGLYANPGVLIYNHDLSEFVLAWTQAIGHMKYRGFAQRIGPQGALIGPAKRVTWLGEPSNVTYTYDLKLSIAYTPVDRKYVVVFNADPWSNVPMAHAWEIFANVLDVNLDQVEPEKLPHRLSTMGLVDSDVDSRAFAPRIQYNSNDDHFLVAWFGDDGRAMVNGALDVFTTVIDVHAMPVNALQTQLTIAGDNPFDVMYDAVEPRLAHNPTTNEYLACYTMDVQDHDDALEIRCSRVMAQGYKLPALGPDMRVSYQSGWNYEAFLKGRFAALVYGAGMTNKFLVAWQGDQYPSPDNTPGMDGALEIYAALIDGSTYAPVTGSFCKSSSKKGMPAGHIAAIVICTFVGAGCLVALVAVVVLHLRKKSPAAYKAGSSPILTGSSPKPAPRSVAASSATSLGRTAAPSSTGSATKLSASTSAVAKSSVPKAAPAPTKFVDSESDEGAVPTPRSRVGGATKPAAAAGAAASKSGSKPLLAVSRRAEEPARRSKKVSRKRPSRKPNAVEADPAYSYSFTYEYYDEDDDNSAPPAKAATRAPPGKAAPAKAAPAQGKAKASTPTAARPTASASDRASKAPARAPAYVDSCDRSYEDA